jgi:hypothetical protein
LKFTRKQNLSHKMCYTPGIFNNIFRWHYFLERDISMWAQAYNNNTLLLAAIRYNKLICELMLTYDTPAYMFNVTPEWYYETIVQLLYMSGNHLPLVMIYKYKMVTLKNLILKYIGMKAGMWFFCRFPWLWVQIWPFLWIV